MNKATNQVLKFAAVFSLLANASLFSIDFSENLNNSNTICVDHKETLSEIVNYISEELKNDTITGERTPETLPINLCVMRYEDRLLVQFAKKMRNGARSYEAGVTSSEAADIGYILKTLSNSSLPKIKGAESSLKKAGDRIDAVHPLQFLLVVFLNEELKVAIRNLKGRAWVWSNFLNGITETLEEENGKNNILPYLQNFAAILNVDVNQLTPFQTNNRWEKFVTTLITIIPRAESADRYHQ